MQVKEPTEGATHVPGFMTVAEAARMLGVSVGALYSRLYRGSYPVVKAGRTILLSDETVMKLYSETRHYSR